MSDQHPSDQHPSDQHPSDHHASDQPLTSLGWDDALSTTYTETAAASAAALAPAAAAAGSTPPNLQEPARVTRVDRGGADVRTAAGRLRTTFGPHVLAAMAEDRSSTPVVGDWAVVSSWPDDRATLDAVLPRRTAVRRLGAEGTSQEQPLAANVDLAVVVEPLLPEPELGRIERMLVLAWSSGAMPVVVLTKADLVPDAEACRAEVAQSAPGAVVLAVSAVTGEGLEPLLDELRPGRTLALLGPSGAGKSTLTNRLAGTQVMATRELRGDGKGRHTTTHRELVELPGGAVLIDAPGLRSVGLVGDEEALASAFADVEELTGSCRFRDCAHAGEPGCAIDAALEAGELDVRRVESWRKLQREVRWQELRHDARLRAQERARWKSVSKSLRRSGVVRP